MVVAVVVVIPLVLLLFRVAQVVVEQEEDLAALQEVLVLQTQVAVVAVQHIMDQLKE
jgi:hypothetical protein